MLAVQEDDIIKKLVRYGNHTGLLPKFENINASNLYKNIEEGRAAFIKFIDALREGEVT